MKIAIVTAGGAGMFCGSCMQDNTLARALRHAGHDVTLIPTYTPIRVDEEENVSDERVFMGGVNVYLDSAMPGWSRLPRFLKSWLDRPGILQRLTRRSSATDAAQLGWLTIDMLKGSDGPQRSEIEQLVSWLSGDLQPDVILFSNALLSGIVPSLRHQFNGPIVCLLQGDDIFLDALPKRWRQPAIDLVRDNCRHFDRLLTHSRWYAIHLAASIGLPKDRMSQIPLSLDCEIPTSAASVPRAADATTIGYFARICPEKGIDNFLDAAERMAPLDAGLRFSIAGFLPELHRNWFSKRLAKAQSRVGSSQLTWLGSPATRPEKFDVLRSFDLLCVPTNYHEPKGLFVLEAALMGVPALLPQHGAFPERINELRHGWMYDPAMAESLDDAIRAALPKLVGRSAGTLQQTVLATYALDVTGGQIGQILQSVQRLP